MWNSGSLVPSNSQHLTIYFFPDKPPRVALKDSEHPLKSRRWITQNFPATSPCWFCYLYCPPVNVFLLPCALFWGVFHKTYRLQHPKWAQHRSNIQKLGCSLHFRWLCVGVRACVSICVGVSAFTAYIVLPLYKWLGVVYFNSKWQG